MGEGDSNTGEGEGTNEGGTSHCDMGGTGVGTVSGPIPPSS